MQLAAPKGGYQLPGPGVNCTAPGLDGLTHALHEGSRAGRISSAQTLGGTWLKEFAAAAGTAGVTAASPQ